jgi:Tfp pilus assembly protein PilF
MDGECFESGEKAMAQFRQWQELVVLLGIVCALSGVRPAPLAAEEFAARGLANLRQGAYAQAVEDLTRAVTDNPLDYKAYHYRGTARVMLGAVDDALADYGRCIELKPDFVPAFINRGVALVGRGQCGEAIADFDRALAIDPKSVEALCHRAICRSRRGEYALAAADYRSALAIDPLVADALNNLAWILATCPDQRLRQPSEAVTLARQAIQCKENPFYFDTLAAALAESGDIAQACASQARAVELLPADAPADQRMMMEQHLRDYRQRQVTAAASGSPASSPATAIATAPAAPAIAVEAASEAPSQVPARNEPAFPFSVQVGACQQRQTARDMAVALRQRGALAYWAPVELAGKGRWYRVYRECLPTLAEAKSALERIRREGGRDAIVARTPFAIEIIDAQGPEMFQRRIQELDQKGFDAYRVSDGAQRNGAERLLVGAFESRAAAEAISRELSAAGVAAHRVVWR